MLWMKFQLSAKSFIPGVKMKTKFNLPVTLLSVLWLFSSGILIATYVFQQPNLSGFGQIAGLLFIIGLIIYLIRSAPKSTDLPDIQPIFFAKSNYISTLLMILGVLILLFVVGIVVHPWLVVVAALTSCAIWIIITHRSHLTPSLVMVGVGAGVLCLLLSGLSGRLDAFQGFYLACIPFLFIGGGILTKVTGLTHIRSVDGHWGLAIKGFVWACVLAFPPALLNSSGGAHSGDMWVDQAWESFVALVPGIAEETWARLFLTTLIYALLRPKTKQRPTRALIPAVFIAAFVHGLAHLSGAMVFSPAALQMLISGLLFGVPMGLLFVKRDFEHAAGYHFFVDFVRYWMAL
jgi:hypothetical protein